MEESILNITVSAFRDYNTPGDPKPVNLLDWLNSRKYAQEVMAIRAEKDKAARDAIKATLPAITPSGEFTYRSARCLVAHSGFIQFDIDLKENGHITNYENLKTEISNISNVAYCGLSVSGTGFWGLIPIAFPGKHNQHFDIIYNAFKDIGISIDKKPRNVAALRGYSYDANAYFNHNATMLQEYYKLTEKPKDCIIYNNNGLSTQGQVEILINELSKKRVDLTRTYNDWLNIGFAFLHEFGEAGRQYFHDVSGLNLAYDRSETDDQYNKCINASASTKPITIKTFFRKCKEEGVLLPKQSIEKKGLKIISHQAEAFGLLAGVHELSQIDRPRQFCRAETFKSANWDKEISELENYFERLELPCQSLKLNQFSIVKNVSLFVESHFATIKANKDKRTFLPYLNRLQELKQLLTKKT